MDTLRASLSEEAVAAAMAAGGGLWFGHAIDEAIVGVADAASGR